MVPKPNFPYKDEVWIKLLRETPPAAEAIRLLWLMVYTDGINFARKFQVEADVGINGAEKAYKRILRSGIFNYNGKVPFKYYCRRIVRNELYRLLKKQNRFINVELPDDTDPRVTAELPTKIDIQRFTEVLQKCVEQHLSRREKQVITERLLDKTREEIAAALGITRNTVSVTDSNARRKLKPCFERNGYRFSDDFFKDAAAGWV